ncbi:MAG: ABC transporter ATP-binding protein [Thermomicrobiales bacterium]|nr:ABC transporter ATP-binding protein [Thermomicrobiales bacterium]
MASVEVREIVKQFGENAPAVDHISLTAQDGEFLVLLGPSGCGKTTLMRMIGGLEPPTSGDVVIGNHVVTHLPPRARRIAMVFQSYALYPHMSVHNNIAFPLKAQGMPKAEQEKRINWAASILGLDGLMERKPRQLSGGQRQRVALARALVREPSVFLLDEPLSNLDAQRRASARDELQQFQRSIGTTTIYVTHDQVEAMGMGDRIAVLNLGTVRQIGTPQEIYDDPADTFVATFLGSPPMNLVERGAMLRGFRPEHFSPAAWHDATNPFERFSFVPHREEYLGAERLIYGEVGDEKVVARFPATTQLDFSIGHPVEFGVATRHMRYFDAESGVRSYETP